MKPYLKGCAVFSAQVLILVSLFALWVNIGEQAELSIIRVSDGKVMHATRGFNGYISAVTYSPDGSLIASACWDGSIKLWSARSGKYRGGRRHLGKLNSVSFSPDGKLLAFGSDDHPMGIIRVSDAKIIRIYRDSHLARSVRFSPDGRFLACATDKEVELRDIKSGEIRRMQGNTEAVWAIAFSQNGRMLATNGGKPKTQDAEGYYSWEKIDLWSMSDFKRVGTYTCQGYSYPASFDFSPDGSKLVSVYGGVLIYRIQDGGHILPDDSGMAGPRYAWQAALSPNGKLLLVTGVDPVLYKFPEMKQLYEINERHTYLSYSAAFSPDSKYVVVGTKDRDK